MDEVQNCTLDNKTISIYFKNAKDPWVLRAKDIRKA